jgi:1,4-dihydroxy-2-naphthoate octaprenyltransferase
MPVWVMLPILSLPQALSLMHFIWKSAGGSILNPALANTAKLALVYSSLLSIGLLLPFW